jgi:DNA-binding MurR/RpiR family transcriptional regulator
LEDLGQKLKQYMKSGTPAERRIARYFSDHLNELPFETASSVADRLELSPMTVGRFLRALGYQGLDGIKVHLRESTAPTGWQLPATMEQLQQDANEGRPLAALMAEHIDVLHHIYNLATQPPWLDAATMTLTASEVFVATHQSLAGLGQHFCHQLQAARDRVQFASSGDNGYVELLGHQSTDALLILVDSRRFAKSRLLARSARRSGYKLLLITSQYTEWAHEFANLTLAMPPSRTDVHERLTSMTALLEFFAAAVVHLAGDEADIRGRRIAELESMFADAPHR